MINETAARTFFAGEEPLGQVIRVDAGDRIVVGIIGDARGFGPERASESEALVPATQARWWSGGTLLVRTVRDPVGHIPRVKAAVWEELPPPRTLEDRFGAYVAQRRFSMLVFTLFGVLGLTIAGVGIYGVMTHIVTQRTREIGVRIALGALPSKILWAVLWRAVTPVGIGLIAGFGITWLAAAAVARFLFNVEPYDTGIYAAVCGVIVLSAFTAAFFPARRAARVDPLIALRFE
jgi:hypothetical protein